VTAILEVKDLHTYYGQSHVLHGISLTVARGETVALVGRNGMGKTTTLASIMGLVVPREGAVRIHDIDFLGAAPHKVARAGVSLVPEGRGIFPDLTVREHLIMAARPGPRGRDSFSLARVLSLFPRLGERMAHTGSALSGGEQQMLSIGRALLQNPDVLLLDEATEGLAPLVRKEIWAVIRQIRAAGVAALIVDKDLKALSEIADRVLIIAKGRIVFADTPQELSAEPEIKQRHLGV